MDLKTLAKEGARLRVAALRTELAELEAFLGERKRQWTAAQHRKFRTTMAKRKKAT